MPGTQDLWQPAVLVPEVADRSLDAFPGLRGHVPPGVEARGRSAPTPPRRGPRRPCSGVGPLGAVVSAIRISPARPVINGRPISPNLLQVRLRAVYVMRNAVLLRITHPARGTRPHASREMTWDDDGSVWRSSPLARTCPRADRLLGRWHAAAATGRPRSTTGSRPRRGRGHGPEVDGRGLREGEPGHHRPGHAEEHRQLKTALRQAAGTPAMPESTSSGPGSGSAARTSQGVDLDLTKYYKQYGWDQRFTKSALSSVTQYGGYHGVRTRERRGDRLQQGAVRQGRHHRHPTTYDELVEDAPEAHDAGITPIEFGGNVNWYVMRCSTTCSRRTAARISTTSSPH